MFRKFFSLIHLICACNRLYAWAAHHLSGSQELSLPLAFYWYHSQTGEDIVSIFRCTWSRSSCQVTFSNLLPEFSWQFSQNFVTTMNTEGSDEISNLKPTPSKKKLVRKLFFYWSLPQYSSHNFDHLGYMCDFCRKCNFARFWTTFIASFSIDSRFFSFWLIRNLGEALGGSTFSPVYSQENFILSLYRNFVVQTLGFCKITRDNPLRRSDLRSSIFLPDVVFVYQWKFVGDLRKHENCSFEPLDTRFPRFLRRW